MPNPLPPAVSSSGMLVDWASTQDCWIRRLVGDVTATGRALCDERATALYGLML